MNSLVGAVDVGATKVLMTVRRLPVTEWGGGERTVRLATPPDPGGLIDVISATLSTLGDEIGGSLIGVGVGTPGPVDAARGVILHSPNQGWRDVHLGSLLAQRLGVVVTLDDDANVGALGEAVLGAGRGEDPVAYVTVSSGIGAGVVVRGNVIRGAHGAAGEIGHLAIDPNGPRCTCGRRGCVEAFAGGVGLERRAREAWPTLLLPGGSPSPRTAADVFRAARSGDPRGRAIVRNAERALAQAFATLIAAIDPAVIVVGGSLAIARPRYISAAARTALRLTLPGAGQPRVVASVLGGDAVLAGAALLGSP
jgi:glucokinase